MYYVIYNANTSRIKKLTFLSIMKMIAFCEAKRTPIGFGGIRGYRQSKMKGSK